jgi:uncharacterized protein YggE
MRSTLAAAALVILSVRPAWAQPPQTYDDRAKITVNGEAVVSVKPDKVVVSLGIETSNADVMTAKQQNNDVLKKAVAAMKELGIPEGAVETDHLSIEPRYRDDYRRESFLGYFVRNTFVVTLTDAGKVEALVTKALEAGVNYIHGIDFQTTEFKKYREQARNLALLAAREKAEKMAAVLGQSVGAAIQISENYSGSPWWYYSSWFGWGGGRSQGMSQNVTQNVQSGSGEISETVALGRISIRANVSVTFALK